MIITSPKPQKAGVGWSAIRNFGLGLLTLAASFGVAQADVLDRKFSFEPLSVGHFPSQDGWAIAAADRGKVSVVGYGLDFQVPGGAFIDGGMRAVELRGGVAPNNKNNGLMRGISGLPTEGGDLFVAVTFEIDTIGTVADPAEFFMRFGGWGAFFAVKLHEGVVEVNGTKVSFAEAGTTGALAGIPHRLVGRIQFNEEGYLVGMSAWLNPSVDDLATPFVDVAMNGTLNAASIGFMDLRSQKVVTVVDDLTFSNDWNVVVPPMPEDPGNLTVTLPADSNETEPGIQVAGGTLFVEVDGAAYVAGTELPIGTHVTFRMVPDTANDYVLTGWRGYKGPRDSVRPFFDGAFADATILAEPTTEAVEVTVPIYAPLNIRPIFEFGDHRLHFVNSAARYRVRLVGNNANQLRTLFDSGENITIQVLGPREYVFAEWLGALAAVETNPVTLVAGAGAFNGTLEVDSTMNFRVREFITYRSVAELDPNEGVDFEALELGAAGSVPLSVMQAVVAEKHAQGLAGVIDFEEILDSGGLIYDPSPAGDMPAPALTIARDEDGNAVPAESVIGTTIALRTEIGERMITVRPGPWGYIEAGGAANLATAAGPGAQSLAEAPYFNGEFLGIFEPALLPNNRRTPISGDSAMGGMTSWDFAFDAEDKVVMSGIAYLSTNNFQHTNEAGNVTLWAQAEYSDGSLSTLLSSNKLDAPGWGGEGGGNWDHFFGFDAPAGVYITNIRVWQRGGNNRSFTSVDDLVIVLEGEEEYRITVSANDDDLGIVAGGGNFADGATATLTAQPDSEAIAFVGWAFAIEPDVVISTSDTFALTVRGDVEYVALFVEKGIDPMDATIGANGGSYVVEVTAAPGWEPESMTHWLRISDITRTVTGGSFVVTVDANFGTEERVGAIMVAQLTHAVTQAAQAEMSIEEVLGGVDQGDGWFTSPWFGTFTEANELGWIYHEDLGWLFAGYALNEDYIILYSRTLPGWIFTTSSAFPAAYSYARHIDWIQFVVTEEGRVYFFDFSREIWWGYGF